MQNIEMSCDTDPPLGEVMSMSANNLLCLHLRDIIHVSSQRYVREFRSLAVPTPPLQIQYSVLKG